MKRAMDLEEYCKYVKSGVEEGLPYELKEAKVKIVYGKHWYAQLQTIRPYSNMTVCYLLTFDYQDYLSGKRSPEQSIADIINNRGIYYVPLDFCDIDFSDIKSLKKRFVSRFVNRESDYIKREDRPVKYIKDTSLVKIWEFHSNDLNSQDDVIMRLPVTTEMITEWGISIDELEKIAETNTPALRPVQIKYMKEIFCEAGIENEEFGNFVVITNPKNQDGAIAVTYPGVRETLIDMIGKDVYILPSSIHECIAVEKNTSILQGLYELVYDMNHTQVEANNFLADDVLEYTQDGQLVSAFRHTPKPPVEENRIFI